jgi:hypothetical protein
MEKPNNEYFITYSNHFIFENQKLAFRKKELFNINNLPIHVEFNEKANAWLINRKHLSKSKAKELLINEPKLVDVSDLQWHRQIQLDAVFNLKENC